MAVDRASDNPFPSVLFAEHVDPSNPDAGYKRLFVDTDHIMKTIDSSGTIVQLGQGLTDPMTTRGDIIVRNSSNVTDRLAIGSSGKVLTSDGTDISWQAPSTGGIAAGTSFPGSPSTNDLYFRTDRGLIYFYNGTRWLTVTLYYQAIESQPSLLPALANAAEYGPMWAGQYDLWLVDFITNTSAAATNNGSTYWTVAVKRQPSNTSLASHTTAADTAGVNTGHRVSIGALAGTSDTYFEVNLTKTGSPGNIYWQAAVTYRLVG